MVGVLVSKVLITGAVVAAAVSLLTSCADMDDEPPSPDLSSAIHSFESGGRFDLGVSEFKGNLVIEDGCLMLNAVTSRVDSDGVPILEKLRPKFDGEFLEVHENYFVFEGQEYRVGENVALKGQCLDESRPAGSRCFADAEVIVLASSQLAVPAYVTVDTVTIPKVEGGLGVSTELWDELMMTIMGQAREDGFDVGTSLDDLGKDIVVQWRLEDENSAKAFAESIDLEKTVRGMLAKHGYDGIDTDLIVNIQRKVAVN